MILANALQVVALKPQLDGEMYAYGTVCTTWTDATIKQGKVTDLKSSKLTSPAMPPPPRTS